MKPAAVILLFLAAAGHASPATDQPAHPEPSLRARIFEFGVALSNEGFKARDGFWSGRLSSGRSARFAVNLFAGNGYWFAAALPPGTPEARVRVYGPDGSVLETTDYSADGLAAAGVTATVTGEYFVSVEAAASADFCLMYFFK
jgi:hypothetical protein